MVRLADLGQWRGGGTPSKNNPSFWHGGDIPWISAKDMKSFVIERGEDFITEDAVLNSAAIRLDAGAVLMVTRSGILRHTFPVAVSRDVVTINQDLKALLPYPGLRAEYIAYGLRAFAQVILHECSKDGTTVQSIDTEALRAFRIPIAPTSEQDRIVAEIEKQFTRLDDSIAALKRVRANLKRYRASVLKAACEGRLVPTEAELARKEGRDYEPASELLKRILTERRAKWEADQLTKMLAAGKPPKDNEWKKKYKEPKPPDVSNLPRLPEGWTWATVESVSTKVVDGVHKKPEYASSGIPFVTVKNLTKGSGIDFTDLHYVTPEDHAEFTKRANPEKGDLLISKDGTLGTVRAVRVESVFSIFVSVAMVKPATPALTDYLEVALSSPQVQVQMVPKGSGLQHIHLEDLRQDCIPLAPLEEQRRIVAAISTQLSAGERLASEMSSAFRRCARLRSRVLGCAFSGKLVLQDPNDEPASALFRGIRTHVAEEIANKSGRKRRVKREKAITATV